MQVALAPFALLTTVSLFLGSLGLPTAAGAQSGPVLQTFAHYTSDDGLPHNTVTGLATDLDGFLWIGTLDGLARFDGHTFTVYRPEAGSPDGLSSAFLHGILPDADGHLWIGTRAGGLCRRDRWTERFRCFRAAPDCPGHLPSDLLYAMDFDAQGHLWIGTDVGTGLFDPATDWFRPVRIIKPSGEALESWRFRRAEGDEHMWFGDDEGVWRVPVPDAPFDTTAEPLTLAATLVFATPAPVRTLVEDGDGRPWAFTSDSRLHYRGDDGERRSLRLPGTLRPNTFPTFHDGRFWIATEDALYALDPSTHSADRVSNEPFELMYADGDGHVWASRWGNGLFHLRPPPPFTLWTADEGLASSFTLAIAETEDGSVWVGTEALDVKRRGEPFRRVPAPPGPAPGAHWALAPDRDVIWVATQARGICFALRAASAPRLACPNTGRLHTDNVYRVLRDRRGWLWLGHDDGGVDVVRNPDALRTGAPLDRLHLAAAPAGPLPDAHIATLYEAPDGAVWVGTKRNGAVRLRVESERIVREAAFGTTGPQALPNADVRAVYQAPNGPVWFATFGGGLARWDGDAMHTFSTADGLPNETLYGILPDAAGHLWLPTNNGLARFDPLRARFTTYTERDGLQDREFNTGAWHRGPTGTLYAGGVGGVNAFDPGAFSVASAPPEVHLTGLRVFDAPRRFGLRLDTLGVVRLPWQEDFVTFEFAAPDFDRPDAVRYRYTLSGVTRQPITTADRTAPFAGLRPGRHRFRVEAFYQDAPEHTSVAEVALVITPPWWRTAWFRWLSVLAVAAGLTGLVRYVSQRQLRARVRALETERRLQHERERISRDLHDNVGTQLTNLKSGLELVGLAAQAGEPARAAQHLVDLEDEVTFTVAQLRETIWALHSEHIALDALADKAREFARRQTRYRERPAVEVYLDPAADVRRLSPTQALHLFRILQEALTNALKHADANVVTVHLAATDGVLTLRVLDDGVGLPDACDGDGYGLANLRARAEELGGTARITPNAPRGTAVEIRIPM